MYSPAGIVAKRQEAANVSIWEGGSELNGCRSWRNSVTSRALLFLRVLPDSKGSAFGFNRVLPDPEPEFLLLPGTGCIEQEFAVAMVVCRSI